MKAGNDRTAFVWAKAVRHHGSPSKKPELNVDVATSDYLLPSQCKAEPTQRNRKGASTSRRKNASLSRSVPTPRKGAKVDESGHVVTPRIALRCIGDWYE